MTPDPREVRDAVDTSWMEHDPRCPECDAARDSWDRAHDPWTVVTPPRARRWRVAGDVVGLLIVAALVFALLWWAGVAAWAAWESGLAESAAALVGQEARR